MKRVFITLIMCGGFFALQGMHNDAPESASKNQTEQVAWQEIFQEINALTPQKQKALAKRILVTDNTRKMLVNLKIIMISQEMSKKQKKEAMPIVSSLIGYTTGVQESIVYKFDEDDQEIIQKLSDQCFLNEDVCEHCKQWAGSQVSEAYKKFVANGSKRSGTKKR